MATRFDDWEGQFLAHHGIRGMMWGVRRYQNPDGSLTAEGQKRYGGLAEGGSPTSARKLARSYNRLDQVRANATGERNLAAQRAFKYGKKFTERGDKLAAKGKNPLADRKVRRNMKKANEAVRKAEGARQAEREASLLQRKVVKKALESGYSVNTRNVKRYAMTGKQTTAQILFGAPGNIAYTVKNRKQLAVNGSYAKISAKGTQNVSMQRRKKNKVPMSASQKDYIRKNAGN